MVDEQILARDLERALAGEDAGPEARELAALLQAAAAPARMPVGEDELERALRAARPGPRARRRLIPALGLTAAAAVAAAIAWIAQTPGSDVQAQAARALGGTFFVVEEVRSSLFAPTDIAGYVDGRTGRAHFRVSDRSHGLVAETVLRSDSSVERWLAAGNTVTLAPTCTVLPGGCAETLDPLDLYLRTVGEARVRRRTGAYELTIHSGRVEQVVTVDAHTFLPRRIVWRQNGRTLSTTRFAALERQTSPVGAEGWRLSDHSDARVVQLTSDGHSVRIVSARPGRVPATARWLGPTYEGFPARVDLVRLTGGSATRISYGPLVVWNYSSVVPPPVLQLRGAAAKVFEIPGGIVHASFGQSGGVVADATFADGNVAVVSTGGDKVDTVRAVQHLVRRSP